MARAVLIAAGALVASVALAGEARAQGAFGNGSGAPPEVVAIQFRLGAAALVGEGAEDVDQPPLQHGSIAVHVRLLENLYLDLTSFGERTLNAEAPEGKTILGIEGATAGLRFRPPSGSNGALRWIGGVGGGGGRSFVQGSGVSWGGSMAYVLAGVERELYGDDFNAGYVGLEGVYQQYFFDEDGPFHGGGITVRLTFSYYMGGSYVADCL